MAAAAAIAPKPDVIFAIPRRFWGEYNSKLADCGSARNDSRLVIERETLHFYESDATVSQIISNSPTSFVALADYTGEGEHWNGMNEFLLSKDGKTLTMRIPRSQQIAQSDFIRYRCPGGR
ncbi:MAG TPA: hypothetical protein VMU59_09890 [Caulobacteraceae bacterium]|nr:hypothetical protein [Caulobacteraceae bacterium]